MAAERISLSSFRSITKTLEDGTRIKLQIIDFKRPNPSDTAFHETYHAVVADKFIDATINPSGDALGSTRPVQMTAMAAAAAAAMGHGGTGWDRHVAEDVLGAEWGAAKSGARSYLAGKEDLVYELATRLEEKGTIYQHDMEEAKQNVKDKRRGIFPAEVEIQSPDGHVVWFPTETLGGEIKISDLLLLPKPAEPTTEIIPFPAKSATVEVETSSEPAPLAKAA